MPRGYPNKPRVVKKQARKLPTTKLEQPTPAEKPIWHRVVSEEQINEVAAPDELAALRDRLKSLREELERAYRANSTYKNVLILVLRNQGISIEEAKDLIFGLNLD